VLQKAVNIYGEAYPETPFPRWSAKDSKFLAPFSLGIMLKQGEKLLCRSTPKFCFIGWDPGTLNEPHLPAKFPVSKIRPNTPLNTPVRDRVRIKVPVPETLLRDYCHEILRKSLRKIVSTGYFIPQGNGLS